MEYSDTHNVLDPAFLERVVGRLSALADATRIRLLMRLRSEPANVTTLSRELVVAQASVSKHLATLRQVGLVAVTREGNQAIYHIRDKSVFDLCSLVCAGVMCHQQEEAAAVGLAAKPIRPQRKTTQQAKVRT